MTILLRSSSRWLQKGIRVSSSLGVSVSMSLFFLLFLFLSLFFRCLDLRNIHGLFGASHLRLDRLLDLLRRLLELGDSAARIPHSELTSSPASSRPPP